MLKTYRYCESYLEDDDLEQVRIYLESLADADNVQEFLREHPFDEFQQDYNQVEDRSLEDFKLDGSISLDNLITKAMKVTGVTASTHGLRTAPVGSTSKVQHPWVATSPVCIPNVENGGPTKRNAGKFLLDKEEVYFSIKIFDNCSPRPPRTEPRSWRPQEGKVATKGSENSDFATTGFSRLEAPSWRSQTAKAVTEDPEDPDLAGTRFTRTKARSWWPQKTKAVTEGEADSEFATKSGFSRTATQSWTSQKSIEVTDGDTEFARTSSWRSRKTDGTTKADRGSGFAGPGPSRADAPSWRSQTAKPNQGSEFAGFGLSRADAPCWRSQKAKASTELNEV